ncbi:MAG: hypothetical protein JW969_20400 [Spirochaetales bacterium]|nr:hypothetical protein [Spirochaetales bacterium]
MAGIGNASWRGTKYLDKALALGEDSAELHLNYSNLHLLENDIEAAREEVKKTAEIDGSLIMNHAMLFLKNNDPESALFYLEPLREVYPNEPVIFYNISVAYKMSGDLEQALVSALFAYYTADLDDEIFGLMYSTYFRLCLDMDRFQVIYDAAFEKVDKTYPSAFLFICLANYKEKKMEDFKMNAARYFSLEGKEMPEDLDAWAAGMVKKK